MFVAPRYGEQFFYPVFSLGLTTLCHKLCPEPLKLNSFDIQCVNLTGNQMVDIPKKRFAVRSREPIEAEISRRQVQHRYRVMSLSRTRQTTRTDRMG